MVDESLSDKKFTSFPCEVFTQLARLAPAVGPENDRPSAAEIQYGKHITIATPGL